MKKDFNRIIYYFMGIIILTVYSLEGTNLHSDFTTTLVSYIILLCCFPNNWKIFVIY